MTLGNAIALLLGTIAGMLFAQWQHRHAMAWRLRDHHEHHLRFALHTWAEAYRLANPTGKYLKRREAALFEACAWVGLDRIAPSHRPISAHDKEPHR